MTELSNPQSGNGLAPYLSRLGLHTEPFSNEIQDEFFLLDAPRTQRLNMLFHLAQNSELLLAVTGELGSGKTSLLQHFIEMGDESWRSCVIDANAMMNPEQLLIQIAEGFGLPQDSVNFGSGIEMLKKRLVEMRRSELISILIIDDAHELPAASLTMLMKLSELSDENEGLLRIVLFSEPQLLEILNASSLKDVRYRVTHKLEIPALNEQETINYIQHRLAVAGLKDVAVFSRNQLKKIYRLSGGIPGKINLHANEILFGGQAHAHEKVPTSWRVWLRSATSMLVIVAIGIAVIWFFTSDVQLPEPVDAEHDAVSTAQQTTRPLPLMPANPITPPANISAETTPASDMTPGITDNVTAESKKAISPVNAYALRQPEIQTKPITTIDKPLPATTKTATATVPATLAPAPADTDKPDTDDKASVSKKTTPVIPEPVAGHWISRQNPEHFTLQVMGSHERLAITRVMHDHKLSPDEAAVLHTRLNNKDWFILVYGSYTSPDKARTAVPMLPRALQLTRPWPRQIGTIKLVK